MFGRRSDATQVTDIPRVRRMMPFISPRRNESLVYYKQEVFVDDALRFCREKNRDRSREERITLFHLYLHACARAINQRPGVNRFVAGGRLWQRHGVWITFSAKQQIRDGSPLVTVKREFPEHETLEEMHESMLENLQGRRAGREDQSDKEMAVALRFPPSLIRLGVWLLQRANELGMLPRSMIDPDPLFTSIFVANLGSVGLDAGYHHLWQYGTCSIFGVMGRVKRRPDGRRYIEVQYSYDERMEDGLYGAKSMEIIKGYIENPKTL